MKTYLSIASVLLSSLSLFSQSLNGAWEMISEDPSGKSVRMVAIFTDGFQCATWYDVETGAFLGTNGGGWSLEDNLLTETVEFDSTQPERAGSSVTFEIKVTDSALEIPGRPNRLTRIDTGESSPLSGSWLFLGRKEGDNMRTRDTDQPRKTMKILSDTRFQWIAYDTSNGMFYGSGGGTYSAENGVYTEQIEFFSRDNSRVGSVLPFKYRREGDIWHHSGNNSKGEPLYELWTIRKKP